MNDLDNLKTNDPDYLLFEGEGTGITKIQPPLLLCTSLICLSALPPSSESAPFPPPLTHDTHARTHTQGLDIHPVFEYARTVFSNFQMTKTDL